MTQSLSALTLLVRDYDEAIAFFVGTLGFELLENTPLDATKRWVRVRPPGRAVGSGPSLLLARAATPDQRAKIGDQAGGRVFLFLETDDLWRDYERWRAKGVRFLEEPREESYGIVVVFQDLYGNRWDLIQPRAAAESTTTWRVRPARQADRDFILGLVPRLAAGFPLPSWRTPEEVVEAESATLDAALRATATSGEVLVAESSAGIPGGFVYLEQHLDYFRKNAHAHVSVLAVAVEAEGQGVGRLLLEAAEAWAREQGLGMLTLNVFVGNDRARAVYERIGFAPETVRYVKTWEM
jgi:ribosomal protein S18 acetylase RimI-like enzyme